MLEAEAKKFGVMGISMVEVLALLIIKRGGGVTSIRMGSYGDYYDSYSYHNANNYPQFWF